MSTRLPDKPAAAGVAANLSVVLVWGLGEFDVSVPPAVAAAMSSLLIMAAYWVTRAREV